MAQNSIYPGFIKIYYESGSHPHVHTIGITNPLGGINSSTVQNKGGTANSTGAAVNTYLTALKTVMPTTANFKYWELFKMANPTAVPVLVDTGLLNIPGTNVGGVRALGQITYSYRSDTGGIGKIVMMETSIDLNVLIETPFPSGTHLTISTYLTGSTSIVTARDGGFPMVVTKAVTKTNDALRKKYFLDMG
jgi:hypothetical protein